MAKIKLNGDTSGYIEISAPAVSGNNTLELGPGTKILTNLDNTFTGITTFSNGIHITSGGFILNQQRSDTHASLIIDKPDAGTGTLKFFNNGSASAYIQHTNSEHLDYYLPSGSGSQVFYTNGTERLRITSGGKVGIRTDNPKQVFSVVGRANFDSNGDYYGAWIDGDSTGSSSFNVGVWHNAGGTMRNEGSHLVLETKNTSHWVQLQPSGGNISVGSNNPNGLLALTASSGRILTLRNSTTGSASGDGSYLALNGSDFQIANAESANIILYTADTERLRIGSDGHLSYKNSSPPAWSTDSGYANVTLGSSAYFRTDTDVNSNFFSLGSNAYRSSSGWQHVNSGWATQLQQSANDGDLSYRSSSTSGSAGGTISWVEHFRLTSSGDVGIGENSPADRLVVQKTNASGDVAVRIKNDTLTDGSASTPTTASLYLNTSTGDFNTFYIQARRYDNDTHFGYSNPRDGGHTPNMIISNEGRIFKPNQPRFFAYASTTLTKSTGFHTYSWDHTRFNVGNHFSTSTNLFTVPVSGCYLFGAQVRFDGGGSGYFRLIISINGSTDDNSQAHSIQDSNGSTGDSYFSQAVTGLYELGANDNVRVFVNSSSDTSWQPHSESQFWGYLVA